jgi:hypothetical protein
MKTIYLLYINWVRIIKIYVDNSLGFILLGMSSLIWLSLSVSELVNYIVSLMHWSCLIGYLFWPILLKTLVLYHYSSYYWVIRLMKITILR